MTLPKDLITSAHLPTLPNGVHHLLETLTNDELDYKQLAATIIRFPVIAARIIALANSAWYAPVTNITTIENACCRLGVSVVRSVSIALAVSSPFDPRRCPAFDPGRFWSTSMLVAEGAELLASGTRQSTQQQDFCKTAQVAGILHNLGLLWLADRLPKQTGNALQSAKNDNFISVAESLRQYADTDYCEIGGWLGDFWKLPDNLVAPMRDHLAAVDKDRSPALVVVIKAAAEMVSVLFRGQDQTFDAMNLSHWGIEEAHQKHVFQQLGIHCEKTQKLAESLFI